MGKYIETNSLENTQLQYTLQSAHLQNLHRYIENIENRDAVAGVYFMQLKQNLLQKIEKITN